MIPFSTSCRVSAKYSSESGVSADAPLSFFFVRVKSTISVANAAISTNASKIVVTINSVMVVPLFKYRE